MNSIQKYMKIAFCLFMIAIIVSADKESPIDVSDSGEGTDCDADKEVAFTCLACSSLDQIIAVPITVCCTEPKAYSVCQICTKDPEGCLEDAKSISSNEFINDGSDEGEPDMDKRFGRMFMGGWTYPARPNKRYGKMFFGGYPGSSSPFGKRDQKDKRFGRVFANGYGYPYRSFNSQMGKRFGRLFTSGWKKRYGSLFNYRNGKGRK